MAALDDIREEFPDLAWLVNDPEVGRLLREAVDPNTTYSAQRFEAKLRQTNWYKKRSQAQRAWSITAHTDPGEANAQRRASTLDLQWRARQLGVELTANQLRLFSEMMLSQGLSPDSPQIIRAITGIYRSGKQRRWGSIRTGQGQAKAMSEQEYMLGMKNSEALRWGELLATGQRTQDDLRQLLKERAMSMYPHLRKDLEEGATMQDLFGGHIQTIAEELELAPETVDLRKGNWLKVLSTHDKTTGQNRPLTLSETRTLARQDNRFWKTANGKEMDSSMSNFLLQTFGRKK